MAIALPIAGHTTGNLVTHPLVCLYPDHMEVTLLLVDTVPEQGQLAPIPIYAYHRAALISPVSEMLSVPCYHLSCVHDELYRLSFAVAVRLQIRLFTSTK